MVSIGIGDDNDIVNADYKASTFVELASIISAIDG